MSELRGSAAARALRAAPASTPTPPPSPPAFQALPCLAAAGSAKSPGYAEPRFVEGYAEVAAPLTALGSQSRSRLSTLSAKPWRDSGSVGLCALGRCVTSKPTSLSRRASERTFCRGPCSS